MFRFDDGSEVTLGARLRAYHDGLLGWAVALALLLLAAGGAAAAPGRVLLGWPRPWAALAAIVLVAAVASACGLGSGRAFLGLAFVPALLLVAAPLPGLRALTGPPLLALAAAGLVAIATQAQRRLPAVLFLPLVLALYAGVSLRAQQQVGPQGDEPHYLMVADSLLRDADLSLEPDYVEGRYRTFHPGPLAPHYRVRGKHGEIFSLHAVGLSVLILPAYALGGYPAVSLFMALLAALLARETRELVRAWTGHDALSEGVAWAVALSPPLIHYAGLVFTEVPAALLVAVVLRRAGRIPQTRPADVLAWAAALAFLPWLNVRYAPLGAILIVYALSRRPRPAQVARLLAPAVASAAALALYHWHLYGFLDPRRVYGRRPEISLATLPEGLQGLLLDQEFGLLVYAPVFVLAGPGLIALLRARRREGLAAVALVAAVLVTAGSWHMWRGGFNPPARFLVPVLPVMAASLGFALREGASAATALALGWSLWTGLSGGWDPRLVHRDRDGTAPLFRVHAGAEEWTRLLPAYVLEEPDRYRLALVWAGALGLAALSLRARPRVSTGGLALATAGLAGAAALASSLSDARTGGRDAVRVVGRSALLVPGWAGMRTAHARWGSDVMTWGPLYEPHRHADGVELGSRLPLPPGEYWLRVEIDDVSPGSAPPALEVRPEGAFAVALQPRRLLFERLGGALDASFAAEPAEQALTLVLHGGGAFVLKEIRLQVQPFRRGPV